MIQALKVPKNIWYLYWIDLEESVPAPVGKDWFIPTLVVICDRTGTPVAPPEIMEELDQTRIETTLYKIFDKTPPPDHLTIPESPDWDHEAWKEFSTECKLEIRFQPGDKSAPDDLKHVTRMVVLQADRGDKTPPSPREVAWGLTRTALRVRSQSKRLSLLNLALAKDPDCSVARIELADMEFQSANWKACREAYEEIIQREGERRNDPSTLWWIDKDTRPYLRAIYGRAMTDWHLSRFAEAAIGLEDLLACNPSDNQGTRFLIPMLHLLAESAEKASLYFKNYADTYPRDFKEPSFLFGWAITASLEGQEALAREKYIEGILRNIYIAPMLLELDEPSRSTWFPGDRAEPNYASEFTQSYALLWDREPGALRILREVYQEMLPRLVKIVQHRELMTDFQDQRYAPDFKAKWQDFVTEEERLTTP